MFSRVTGSPSTLFDIFCHITSSTIIFVACVGGGIVFARVTVWQNYFFVCERFDGGVERAAAPGFFLKLC